jgi:hypothetical protein
MRSHTTLVVARIGAVRIAPGTNQPKNKRRNQTPAGRESDYDDIASDGSLIAFDAVVQNDFNAPRGAKT